jgi:hypothetical protein
MEDKAVRAQPRSIRSIPALPPPGFADLADFLLQNSRTERDPHGNRLIDTPLDSAQLCCCDHPVNHSSMLTLLALILTACSKPGARHADPHSAGRPTAALLNGEPIAADQLGPRLAEAAGAVVLEDIVLLSLLERAAADAGLSVTEPDLEAERALLAQTISSEAQLTPDQAAASLGALRISRGLGRLRFADLLRRNALLRALARPRVEVSAQELSRAVETELGPRLRVRVLTAATDQTAAAIRASLLEKPDLPQRSAAFAQAAFELSTDVWASRGGLVEPISPADLTLPAPLRAILPGLMPGDVSPVLVTEDGPMLVLVEELLPAAGEPTLADRERIHARVRLRRERLEMDRLARQLLATADVAVFDPGLRWSWENRPK